ncbi:MAG: hypothetical protein R3Y06_08100 [Faecalibacterium sp.]
MKLVEQLERSFKKLKSSVYFDKTQLPQRTKLVEYESEHGFADRFRELADILSGSDAAWQEYTVQLLESIEVLTFPKSLQGDVSENPIVFNDANNKIKVSKVQNMMEADVEVQLLGVLWILTIGRLLDETGYEHSYGNRLKKNLLNKESEEVTFSPHLFRPYFQEYESWRDKGLKIAEDCMEDGKDVIVLTLDLTSFYYSIDFREDYFLEFYEQYKNQCGNQKSDIDNIVVERLNDLVYKVLWKYSEKLRNVNSAVIGKNVALPIGYLPSNILSNWYLEQFDSAVTSQVNARYYGRYVDDIIIVETVEKNSELFKRAKEHELTQVEVIDYLLCNCSASNQVPCDHKKRLFVREEIASEEENKGENGKACKGCEWKKKPPIVYAINTTLLHNNEKSKVKVQNQKVKVFYFKAGSSKALLSTFRNAINQNKSEFRFLPEDEAVLLHSNYSEIFDIQRESGASVNKFRELNNVSLNKFNLSKFLGKSARITQLIADAKEGAFEKDLLVLFDEEILIDFYIFWERILQTFILNEHFEQAELLIRKIVSACEKVEYIEDSKQENQCDQFLKDALYKHLYASVVRSLALVWGDEVNRFVEKICEIIPRNRKLVNFNSATITRDRYRYCQTYMVNKYAMPGLLQGVSFGAAIFSGVKSCNLSTYKDYTAQLKGTKLEKVNYKYFPYMISLPDIEMLLYLQNIYQCQCACDYSFSHQLEQCQKFYVKWNYPNVTKSHPYFFENIQESTMMSLEMLPETLSFENTHYFTKATTVEKSSFKIAIANVKMSEQTIENALKGELDRSFNRYRHLCKVINQAISEHADVLIMPEAYIPFEWLWLLSQRAASNNMAIITGVEHIVTEERVLNLTATILPYAVDDHIKSAHINLRNKVHYSPEETRLIYGYGQKIEKGEGYDLFCWNDLWFSVYCCFELASIQDRALFATYVDAIFAVEWNKDTNYYSSIIESLSRDLHCYCAQVNTSNYGDSRIVIPTNTILKDLIRTKGGENDTVLIAEINPVALREFQRKEYELQKEDKSFKPTPPNFNRDIVKGKINKTLL